MKSQRLFLISCLTAVLLSFSSFSQNYFPQEKVNKVYFTELNNLVNGNKKTGKFDVHNRNVLYHSFGSDDIKNSKKLPDSFSEGDLYVGAHDTILIDADTTINNNIILYQNGVVIVDNADLILSGSIYAVDSGSFILRNQAYLRFNQFFINQYGLHLLNHAVFDAEDATIDGNGVPVNEIELYDSSKYIARNVIFNDWSFRKLFDHSTLILEDVDYVGDMLVKHSCHVSMTRCALLLPWLEIPDSSVISMSFPNVNPFNPTDTVYHFEFNEAVPNVDGIGYSITIDTCTKVIWGMDVQPGSNLTVSNSKIFGFCHRFMHSDTMNIMGIRDSSYYLYLNVPFTDRTCQLINTSVYSWQLYGQADSAVVYVDSCSFGELMAKENCEVYASNSICDGIWLHLGTVDNGFLSFSNSLNKSFADTWQRSTLLLTNSEIRCTSGWAPPPLGPNYAHHHSYFLSVNSAYDFIPYALDTSLVIFLFLDIPALFNADTASNISIDGSAWLQAGTNSNVTFSKYKLYYSEIDSISWNAIGEFTDTVTWGVMGYWDISTLPLGDYIVKLTLFDSNNDSLSALRKVTLTNTASVTNQSSFNQFNYSIYPNPTNGEINIQLPSLYSHIKIFDAFGNVVFEKTLNSKQETLNLNLSSGMYFYQVIDNKKFFSSGKLIMR